MSNTTPEGSKMPDYKEEMLKAAKDFCLGRVGNMSHLSGDYHLAGQIHFRDTIHKEQMKKLAEYLIIIEAASDIIKSCKLAFEDIGATNMSKALGDALIRLDPNWKKPTT